MNWFGKVDTWLIEKIFEPIAWRVEYKFGRDTFFLARVTATAAYTSAGLLLPMFVLPMAAISCFCELRFINLIEHQVRRNRDCLNPMKFRLFPRAVTLGLASFILFGVSSLGWVAACVWSVPMMLLVAAGYFTACNLMPPKWQPKKKEYIFVPRMGLSGVT